MYSIGPEGLSQSVLQFLSTGKVEDDCKVMGRLQGRFYGRGQRQGGGQ